MEKVLVLEDNQVNEYGVLFDQEYMNILLEEYRKNFSHLREGKLLTCGSCSKDTVKNVMHYFNDIVSFSVANSDTEGFYELSYVGAINPVAYGLLRNDEGNFTLDNRKMHALVYWTEAVEHQSEKDRRKSMSFSLTPINDFMGLDEQEDVVGNVSSLLEDVSLEYLGEKKDVTVNDMEIAKVGTRFVERFNVTRVMSKQLKK